MITQEMYRKLCEVAAYQFQEFIAGLDLFKLTSKSGGSSNTILLLNPAHHHTHMGGFDNHSYSFRL